MKRIPQRAAKRNTFEIPPDLFTFARERDLWRSPPVARIARRFGLPITTAATIATLAGLVIEGASS